jgi:hypothetical protein
MWEEPTCLKSIVKSYQGLPRTMWRGCQAYLGRGAWTTRACVDRTLYERGTGAQAESGSGLKCCLLTCNLIKLTSPSQKILLGNTG